MQFSVILGILLTILNNRKKVTRQQLADKYELNPRTITRYLAVIETAGVPIEYITGRNGGIALPDTYKLDRSFFSKEELKRLHTCVAGLQSGFDDGLNRLLLDKIGNMAQNKEDEKYLLKSDTLVVDTGNWINPQVYRNKIETINKSIAAELSLRVEYVDRHEYKSERKVDPYSLVLKEGVWYLYGWCHLRRDFRLLKLSRIRSMTILTSHFARQKNDVYQKLNEAFDDKALVDLEVEFSNTILSDIEEWLGIDAIKDIGKAYHARAEVYGGNVLINKLLSFGSSIKVLGPAALKEELLTECKRVVQSYE